MALPLHFPRDSQRALDHLLSACASNAACRGRFPDLGDQLEELLRELEQSPRKVSVRHPRTGEDTEATITRRMVALTLRQALYSPLTGSLVPLAIDQAARGEFEPLAALMFSSGGLEDEIADGMYLSVTCSEDFPRMSAESVDAESAGTFIGRDVFQTSSEACEHWPRGEVESSYYDPVRSDLPALILSGEVDPVTPPSWGARVAQHLPNSRHIISPGTGHGVMSVGCGMRLISKFLEAGSAADLDASCLEVQARPAFFLNFAGPYPLQKKEAAE
jgi:pimeloyl-ACP methyl ester carboxylesterase